MNGNIIHLSVVDSTNIYTTKLLSQTDTADWTIVTAEHQTAGKGQRGKKWESDIAKNLLCSIVSRPKKITIESQFLVSMATSLAVIEVLASVGITAKVKWPNDILVRGKKICGLLIENQWSSGLIDTSILGIGLNVNQTKFSPFDWPATSMAIELGIETNLNTILNSLSLYIQEKISGMPENYSEIMNDYSDRLFAIGQIVTFKNKDEVLVGRLLDVDQNGAIRIQNSQGVKSFVNGEIKIQNI